MGSRLCDRRAGDWEGGARWDGATAAAPGGSARDEKRTRFLSRFLAAVFQFSGSVGSGFGRWGGPILEPRGGAIWDAPAEARRARPEANFGTFCGRDTGVLAEPARGTFYGHLASHAQGGTPLACLAGIFCLCRSYPYNDDFWTDVHHVCIAQRERRATVCYSPGGLEK